MSLGKEGKKKGEEEGKRTIKGEIGRKSRIDDWKKEVE